MLPKNIGVDQFNETLAALHDAAESLGVPTEKAQSADLAQELLAIGKHCAALPLVDKRSPDEILGYNAQGLSE